MISYTFTIGLKDANGAIDPTFVEEVVRRRIKSGRYPAISGYTVTAAKGWTLQWGHEESLVFTTYIGDDVRTFESGAQASPTRQLEYLLGWLAADFGQDAIALTHPHGLVEFIAKTV